MTDITEALKNWIIRHLKHRDVVHKKITAIEENVDGWTVVLRGEPEKHILVIPSFEEGFIGAKEKMNSAHTIIATLNTKQNVDAVVTHWKDIVSNPTLHIYFINPYSLSEQKWVLCPASHDRIAERRALKRGLESLSTTVEEYQEVRA